MPVYRGSLKVVRGAGLAIGMLATKLATISGELSAVMINGKLSATVSGTRSTVAVSDTFSSSAVSVLNFG